MEAVAIAGIMIAVGLLGWVVGRGTQSRPPTPKEVRDGSITVERIYDLATVWLNDEMHHVSRGTRYQYRMVVTQFIRFIEERERDRLEEYEDVS